ncbi:MAG: transcription-repair coupling factor [Bacteroidetes bacterium]|nr:transcription-repair coupling factor [Bacteroidota bacterium]
MKIDDLIGLYRQHPMMPALQRLHNTHEVPHIAIKGLHGSTPAIVICALYTLQKFNAVFILNDQEEAAYLLNDLENLLGTSNVIFFPSSYRKTNDLFHADNNHVLQRADVLNRISRQTDGLLIVTHAAAVFEKVTTKSNIEQNTFDAKRGSTINQDFLSEFLDENEFELTDFVYQAGQYALRGSIMDVYSFANELPYRIEFYDNKIESIRTFDPNTQLSVQQLDFISIIPNIQTRLLKESKESFFNFISPKYRLWFNDLTFFNTIIPELYQSVIDNPLPDENFKNHFENFESLEVIHAHFERYKMIEYGNTHLNKDAEQITFNTKAQPSFNKNFDLIVANIIEHQKEKIKTTIIADQSKQIERLYSIFEDIAKPYTNSGQPLNFTTLLLALHGGFIDHDLKIAIYTDHQLFNRYHRYRLKKNFGKGEAISLKDLYALKPGDFVTHIDHGVGRFGGLEMIEVNGRKQEAIRLIYKDNDVLSISIHSLHRIARYSGKEGAEPSLNKLGSAAWANLKLKAKKRVKDIAKELIALYAKRKMQKGFAYAPDNYLQAELEASFIYEDTPDQLKATVDVKSDMEKQQPMDRLICGDVGFGKTEIAIRAAFKAVCDSKQVAILVPTTILALQHYRTFSERLKNLPCNIDYINRFKTSAQQKESLLKLKEGKTDIIIGTHRLISKDVKFDNLGLLIIDEEQKFGVASKEKLKEIRASVDTLTLTATPIPRTLQFSLMGARDLSIINTPPPNRYPVTTEIHTFNEKIIKESILYEVSRGGQVFVVHNRISDIHDIADMIRRMCPDVSVAVGHGQMEGDKLEEILLSFIEGDTDVLVSTTIIEAGLDISNANTIIINQAQNFGLSDLHQMRGRVGRSNKKAFCYLLTPPVTVLTPEARQRLKAIEEFSDLGAGFHVAMRDLDIRGAGNMLGGEQSGFIADIGFETFQKILDEAIFELKQTDFKDTFEEEIQHRALVRDCVIDTDFEILLPQDYITSITERLNLYKVLDDVTNEEDLQKYAVMLRDRFGEPPQSTIELMDVIRLRWKATSIGFEKMVLKNRTLKGTFGSDDRIFQSEGFNKLIDFIKNHPHRCKLKEDKGRTLLILESIDSVAKANSRLAEIVASMDAIV